MSAIKITLEWHLNKEIGVVVVAYRSGNWWACAWNSCAFGKCAWRVNAFTLQIYISHRWHSDSLNMNIYKRANLLHSGWKCCKFMSVSRCCCVVSHYRLCLWGNPRKLKCFIVYPSLNICIPFDASLLLFPTQSAWPILSETQCVVHFPNWRLVKALTLPLALIKIIVLAVLVLRLRRLLRFKHKDPLKVRLLLVNIIIPSCSSRRAVPLYLDCLQLTNQGKP